jgi:hypothetical protein
MTLRHFDDELKINFAPWNFQQQQEIARSENSSAEFHFSISKSI